MAQQDIPPTQSTGAIHSVDGCHMDADERSFVIGTAKIRALEERLENYFGEVEQKLGEIRLLQQLKNKVIQGGETLDTNKNKEVAELLEKAQQVGLDWNKSGWSDKNDRDALIDALHVAITDKETTNQTTFMRINRLMNLRSEVTNLFSKLAGDTHNEKIRVLGRLQSR